jgi:hypothetical protein
VIEIALDLGLAAFGWLATFTVGTLLLHVHDVLFGD